MEKTDLLLAALAYVIQLSVIIGYFTRLENRLTKLETTVEILLKGQK